MRAATAGGDQGFMLETCIHMARRRCSGGIRDTQSALEHESFKGRWTI